MKRMLIVIVIAIAASSIAFGQTKMSKDSKVEAQVIEYEKQSWEALKNNNRSFFESIITDDAVIVDGEGVVGKTQYINNVFAPGCKLKSYSTDDFKVVMFDKKTAMVTYKANQDFACNGKQAPATIWISSLYVNRGGKWLNSFFQFTPIAQ